MAKQTDRQVDLRLIKELKKPGREPVFDMQHKLFKMDAIKKCIWTEIGKILQLTGTECETKWKNLKKRYSSALRISQSPARSKKSSSKRSNPNQWLITEMQFFKNYIEDPKPVKSMYETVFGAPTESQVSTTEPDDLDEQSQTVSSSDQQSSSKRRKFSTTDPLQPLMINLISTTKDVLEFVAKKCETTNQECFCKELDPYFFSLSKDCASLTDAHQLQAKIEFMKIVEKFQNLEREQNGRQTNSVSSPIKTNPD